MTTLCQIADVKTYLGITNATEDANLTALIAAASAWIENYCNRVFSQATYTETRNGNNARGIYLYQSPITAVSSVTVDGVSIPAAASSRNFGFVFDDETVYIQPGIFIAPIVVSGPFGLPDRFERGVQNVTVTYTAGYAVIPADLVQACVELVVWKRAKASRLDKTSETLGTQQTQAYAKDAVPPSVIAALNSYRLTMVPP